MGAKEIVTVAFWSAVVLVIGVLLLNLAVSGSLPNGFGLWDMSNDVNRAITFLILVAIVVVLAFVYRGTRGRQQM